MPSRRSSETPPPATPGGSASRLSRGLGLVVAAAIAVAACSDGASELSSDEATEAVSAGEAGTAEDPDADSTDDEAVPDDPGADFDYGTVDYDLEPVDSALIGNRENPQFPPPVVEPALIRSGGPPPDGIPPIDDPQFVPVAEVDFVADEEAVILVEVDGDARAYPIQILIWHEIVNDQFGEVPVSVTYCPLCNSALAYDRRFGDRVLDFGTSGELYQSALVMYDRQTESLWAHFTGQGLVGHYAGAQLDFIPAQTVSFAQFREAHPDGRVLTRDTGASRPYGQNPYPGYDFEGSDPIGAFFDGEIDRTLLAKARIVGISDAAGSVAVRLEDLSVQPVIPITEDGRNLVVFHRPGLASALESAQIDGGRDVGQTGVFVAESADGTGLSFTADGDGFVDDQTGSTWNVVGQAVAGPLQGEQLQAVSHLDTFWFAWATYRPGTVIIEVS